MHHLRESFHFCAQCERPSGLTDLVVTSSGVAERDCVFITPDEFGAAIWYVTRHEPEKWFVEMLKIVPGVTACRLEIQLTANEDECFADVTYSHTSIGTAGDEFVARFTADHYQKFMQAWERELNYFLKSGSPLTYASNQSALANQQKS